MISRLNPQSRLGALQATYPSRLLDLAVLVSRSRAGLARPGASINAFIIHSFILSFIKLKLSLIKLN